MNAEGVSRLRDTIEELQWNLIDIGEAKDSLRYAIEVLNLLGEKYPDPERRRIWIARANILANVVKNGSCSDNGVTIDVEG